MRHRLRAALAGDLDGLGRRGRFDDEPLNIFGGSEVHALREFLDVEANREFHLALRIHWGGIIKESRSSKIRSWYAEPAYTT